MTECRCLTVRRGLQRTRGWRDTLQDGRHRRTPGPTSGTALLNALENDQEQKHDDHGHLYGSLLVHAGSPYDQQPTGIG